MATISISQKSTNFQRPNHSSVVEEITGLIRVYKDGHVERPPIVPHVSCMVPLELDVVAKDVTINKFTNLWARVYAPAGNGQFSSTKLPLLVYFHGGGFCVGSASWACYHDFLTNLARVACCVIVSVNYRLAPEDRLPAAYDDGVNTIMWLKEASKGTVQELQRCDLSSLYLAGDSAGANIAQHVASRLISWPVLSPKGIILIQPFFGGESRTMSEKHSIQPSNSALSLLASDTYWRLVLPIGATRDHPWCNPLAKGAPKLSALRRFKTMIHVAELDILKERNIELAAALSSAGVPVHSAIYKDVGHAFHILHNYPMARTRTHEMMTHIKAFINQ